MTRTDTIINEQIRGKEKRWMIEMELEAEVRLREIDAGVRVGKEEEQSIMGKSLTNK